MEPGAGNRATRGEGELGLRLKSRGWHVLPRWDKNDVEEKGSGASMESALEMAQLEIKLLRTEERVRVLEEVVRQQ